MLINPLLPIITPILHVMTHVKIPIFTHLFLPVMKRVITPIFTRHYTYEYDPYITCQ
jgi:hypothetical protein